MRTLILSALSVMAMSSSGVAGGSILNVEPAVEPVIAVEKESGKRFYVGAGYSFMNMNIEGSEAINAVAYPPLLGETDLSAHAMTLLAGYDFNRYLAVEGRYTFSLGDLDIDNNGRDGEIDADLSNLALYLKPMYPIGGLTLYGLLGYGKVTLDDGKKYSESGFQWGIGAGYNINDTIGVFVDYTRLYDDKGFDTIWGDQDVVVDAVNVGVTYEF
ncbi:outer membrane beta-barrel protein [Sulfurovum sp.]|uniref:outer membrane beta-barrel protein n=1 Tax=Sulfurovum sp. TaxID=1969726 RepID=UPI002A36FD57|nr:outer membrane beta-barrel protein [Sulfurovum sp.]MDD2450856.1 outer membrane beta-barrel protein [Sulfurovum sp.]MDD3499342.1 outer membrane beta-barrel protein [Sulfurovum sp.]MDY0402138.1 outer membrane beta-barrel protein [Sulfurovum sp.]